MHGDFLQAGGLCDFVMFTLKYALDEKQSEYNTDLKRYSVFMFGKVTLCLKPFTALAEWECSNFCLELLCQNTCKEFMVLQIG